MSDFLASEIIGITSQSLNQFARWRPYVGSETLKLLNKLEIPKEGKETILKEAISILSRCTPPTQTEDDVTGLVVGYVQSGKTMSFTTVSSLALDNRYQIIIVITGISAPLFRQSTQRLQQDLELNTRSDRKWQHFSNPSLKGRADQTIRDILGDWKDPTVPILEQQTVLITVMKNHRHLKNLIQVLSKLDLQRVPTIVIDDEADQAGLNTLVKDGEESTTYQRLLHLKASLPHHTFLQYTATPQAPLLINLIDMLSPDFAEVLTPGADYVGGQDFFSEPNKLISVIPESEISTKHNEIIEPSESLLYAIRIFLLGVAAGLVKDGGKGNRSMLVHPSLKTMGHKQYYSWVMHAKELWKSILELNEQDLDHKDLLSDFHVAYQDLLTTVSDLPPFESLTHRLLHAVRRTRVEEVNSTRGKTPQIDWKANYSYILVGGQAMDRGFTIEGLTVTYMSRGIGVGNADTVQQRARFFGYKKSYLGYCRVFLENVVRDSYHHYVEHEEDIRRQLLIHRDTGKPLSEWKRAFFLTPMLKPTRDNVLDLDYMRGNFSDDWYAPKAPHESEQATQNNRIAVEQFLAGIREKMQPDVGHEGRTDMQRHLMADCIPLKMAYIELLTQLRIAKPSDSQKFVGLMIQIKNYLETHPNDTCRVYVLSRGKNPSAIRERSEDAKKGEIPTLFQGAYPDRFGKIYPGDRNIHAENELTIHIQYLRVLEEGTKNVVADNVPAITVWVPRKMSSPWYSQEPASIKGQIYE
ncbi:hypothetical protein KDA_36120 [Dictyobacter alpinus]|uniref:Putative endonuclease Z1 domain-containing protein n=1 Tax=Dictyobacter alpinus TaxID=2014873 RepID=A0A402B9T1_9CHLR|nr:Z1 domain-containing protein [Dictyobacter alpinus]GCE28128.1 hypothetical protein KDA_36120 [Dictyobacter alpinus]